MMEQNRLSHSARTAILLAILAVLTACEKPLLGEDAGGDSATEANVTATGGQQGAGIGTGKGWNSSNKTQCGNIRIEGGTVTATGGQGAAAIGSSWHSTCGTVSIADGLTDATVGNTRTITKKQ